LWSCLFEILAVQIIPLADAKDKLLEKKSQQIGENLNEVRKKWHLIRTPNTLSVIKFKSPNERDS